MNALESVAARVPVELLPQLALLLDYPGPGLLADTLVARSVLAGGRPIVTAALNDFVEAIANIDLNQLEEVYARTFYIAPVCVPYVSVHLFGEESYKRGELMARLRGLYEEIGFDAGDELPDHLAVLMRVAPLLDVEIRDELIEYCLCGPASAMAASLGRTENPYRHVLVAIAALLGDRAPRGVAS